MCACELNIPLTVLATERIPNLKRRGLESFGADVRVLGADKFFEVLADQHYPGTNGARFLRPGGCPEIIAGNGSVALEIVEDIPDVDVIAVPFGSGGLACSVGIVLKELRPQAKLVACEVSRK